jgi:trehalose 6-phosphate synthase
VHRNTSGNAGLAQRDSSACPWTVERVQASLSAFDGPAVVLANREPVRHDRAADGSIVVRRSASGLVTALEPLI